MDNWLSDLTSWLVGLVKSFLDALLTFLHDVIWWAFDGVLHSLGIIISSIPVPSFLSSGLNLASIFSGFPPFALFLLSELNLVSCFAVLGAGISFRLVRKLSTLGQW